MNPPEKTYKEKNGTTRVGDALRWMVEQGKNVAPDLLSIASDISGIEALDKLGSKISGSKELTELDKKILLERLKLDKAEFQSISNRWNSDMVSDSWLSKNTRPLMLIYLTFITTVYVLLDSAEIAFKVDEVWIDLLKNLLITIYVAYFGSRGFEKFSKIRKN